MSSSSNEMRLAMERPPLNSHHVQHFVCGSHPACMWQNKQQGMSNPAGGGAAGSMGKKGGKRPPPLETADTFNRNFYSTVPPLLHPQQQYISIPVQANWDLQEQTQLDRLVRYTNPHESLLSRSTRMAGHMPQKSIREVAMRLKMMEESNIPRTMNFPQDDTDRNLDRLDVIITELSRLVGGSGSNKTFEQKRRVIELMHEFTTITQQTKHALDSLNVRMPTNLLVLPDFPPQLMGLNPKFATPSTATGGGGSEF